MSYATGHIIGVVAGKPRFKQQSGGGVVVNFTVESYPRRYDNSSNRWVESAPVRIRCNAWNDLARNIADSLNKGDHVIVMGRLRNNEYTDPSGVVHEFVEFDIDSVGPDLRFHVVDVMDPILDSLVTK